MRLFLSNIFFLMWSVREAFPIYYILSTVICTWGFSYLLYSFLLWSAREAFPIYYIISAVICTWGFSYLLYSLYCDLYMRLFPPGAFPIYYILSTVICTWGFSYLLYSFYCDLYVRLFLSTIFFLLWSVREAFPIYYILCTVICTWDSCRPDSIRVPFIIHIGTAAVSSFFKHGIISIIYTASARRQKGRSMFLKQ